MGSLFALLAALCNSTIGTFSKLSFASESNPSSLAFFRCLLAFGVVSVVLCIKRGGVAEIVAHSRYARRILVVSFFGVFVLYYFEIWALRFATIPEVSFLLYASGVVGMVLGVVWLKEAFDTNKLIAALLVLSGVAMLFLGLFKGRVSLLGGVLAILAGTGYSIFLVLTKKFFIPGTLPSLWWLFGFGSLFLFVPFLLAGPSLPAIGACPYVLCLAIIPTLGGYYFTNKALSLAEVSSVQIFEMSEPIFASVLALTVVGETLSPVGIGGASLIVIGLVCLQYDMFSRLRRGAVLLSGWCRGCHQREGAATPSGLSLLGATVPDGNRRGRPLPDSRTTEQHESGKYASRADSRGG